MELKLNTWYVWLWNYTYSERLPDNLCPFFWKLVIAILLFIPNVILRLPITIINLFSKDKIDDDKVRTGMGIIVYIIIIASSFIIACIYSWLLWLFNAYSYDSTTATFGGLFLLAGLTLLIAHYWKEYNTGNKVVYSLKNNIVVNYTNAWYYKHCPKINWK